MQVSTAMAKKTAALVPVHQGTPWVLINGVSFTGQDLLTAVCAAIKGAKPAGCSKEAAH